MTKYILDEKGLEVISEVHQKDFKKEEYVESDLTEDKVEKEVENEVEKTKKNKNDEEIKKLKINILNKKKEEKLNLFSRSHFLNLENSQVVIWIIL